MMRALPAEGAQITDEKAGAIAQWWHEFRPLLAVEARKYISPENVAKASVPGGIILGCSGVGAMIGGPMGAGVGAFVGKLITGEVKPGKAVDGLLEAEDSAGDIE